MAEAVAEGLRALRCEVDLFRTDEGRFDVARFPHAAYPDEYLRQRLPPVGDLRCGIRLARPFGSQVAGRVKQFGADHWYADVRKAMKGLKGRPYALFYSHCGRERAIEAMRAICGRVRKPEGEPVSWRGHPNPQVLEKCRALGQAVLRSLSGAVLIARGLARAHGVHGTDPRGPLALSEHPECQHRRRARGDLPHHAALASGYRLVTR